MARMFRIHEILQEGKYPNCTTLAADLEVVPRTIMRDLDCMRDRLKLPIAFEAQRRGYYYTQPVAHFPSPPMSEAEVFGLLVANKAIAQYHGTPFAQILEKAYRKLTGQLDAEARFSLGSLDAAFSFRPFAPEEGELRSFEMLTTAVRERREMRFRYRKVGRARAERRHVRPYHLGCVENQWYLFAFDLERQAMRTFLLSRLTAPELLEERFTLEKPFDLNEYLRGSFGVFKGAEDHEVVIDFDAWAADLVRGRRWHHSQELIELPRRGLRLKLRLNSLEEAERWVLSWGVHATAVQPQRLVARIRAIAGQVAARYRQ